MNHKWNKDNICLNCGIARMKIPYKQVIRTYSKLGSDGCFYDVPIYQYGTAWYYGTPNEKCDVLVKGIGFERPDCKKKEIE